MAKQKRDSKGRFVKAHKKTSPKKHSKPVAPGTRQRANLKFSVSSNRQVGKTTVWKDKLLPALPPGKRVSKDGKIYYEFRKNRSDKRGSKV